MKKIKVLIVDDSALVRKMLTEILDKDPQIEVVGTVADPYQAREKIKKLNPDVLTLDVEMPRMDGVTFLSKLMRLRPMPVVMVSTLTEQGADITLQALQLGAVDFVTKPKVDFVSTINNYAEELIEKVKVASKVSISTLEATFKRNNPDVEKVSKKISKRWNFKTTDQLIAIGASTGGTEAIKEVLATLPANAPGIVITQHIPAGFSASFAKRLNEICALEVCEAKDGQQIIPGHVYVAPGNLHLSVIRSGARFICKVKDGELVSNHKPSVDVLFNSVAKNIGQNAVGVILTGMGKDGAEGMLNMLQAGARTIAQDEKTSVVWGMPGSAVKISAAETILPLQDVSNALLKLCSDEKLLHNAA